VHITTHLYIGSLFHLFQLTPSALGVQGQHNTLFTSHTDLPRYLEATCKLEAQADARKRVALSFRYTPQLQTPVVFREQSRERAENTSVTE